MANLSSVKGCESRLALFSVSLYEGRVMFVDKRWQVGCAVGFVGEGYTAGRDAT